MSAISAGKRFDIPCVLVRCYADTSDPYHPPRTPNCYTKEKGAPGQYRPELVEAVTGITWHTVHGTASGAITPAEDARCLGENGAMANAKYFAKPASEAASTFILADNGVALQVADLTLDRPWHASAWNPFTIGVELDQSSAKEICAPTLFTAVNLAWWFCHYFGVQPMLPVDAKGNPNLYDIPRLEGNNARSFRGHYFHAGQASRGTGDPGPALPLALLRSGFEGVNLATNEDLAIWKARQNILGLPPSEQDGVPGPRTVEAMRESFGRSTWAVRRDAPPCDTSDGGGGLAAIAIAAAIAAGAVYYARRRGKKRK